MNAFPSIDRVHQLLDEIAESLPEDFFRELNEGIVLLPDVKYHPKGRANDLYILGEYHRSVTGRHIRIYYGSYQKVHPYISEEDLKRRLEKTLLHEFTHHLESLAGLKDLEVEDRIFIHRYLNND